MTLKRIIGPSLLFMLGATLLIQLPIAIAGRASVYEWFDPIVDVRRILVDRYVEPIEDEELPTAMINAMLEQLEDPYTQYIPASDTAEFNKQLRGVYAGIGAEVNIKDGFLVIVTPMDDSPSLHAGVMAGDVVLEIEGESTFEQPVSWCVERLTGEVGTPVTIRVRHLDDTEEEIVIVRRRITTRTVKGLRRRGEEWNYCVDEGLGLFYIRVTQFNADTVIELETALADLVPSGMNGLILDLRDNPGGGLPTAVQMADLFLEEGKIVEVQPRIGESVTYRANRAGTMPGFEMLVLVNGSSASASEIVAGALQENGRAKVLGTRTFGKGSVQEVRALSYGGGTLKYTTAHYYLPSGRNLNRNPDAESWGVDPDPGFLVPVTDEAFFDAFRARREFEIIRVPEDEYEACVSPDWVRENLKDEPLALAVEALQGRLQTGAWSAVTDEEQDPALIAFNQELERALKRRASYIEQLHATEERIEELQALAESHGDEPLLPEDLDLVEGTITLHDRDGNLIGTYQIEGGDVRLALDTVSLVPVMQDGESDFVDE
ncbi:MAG: S41 family peptidase [Planctomycetes bacterium]|nr:S41 family peptidase [Planctomycetota bacterium]